MDLERLALRLRPRRGWESVDLGFALVRHWRRRVYGGWLAVMAPLALLLVTVLGGKGLLLLWWLLPLGEAVVLFILSRAVFGSMPSGREVLRALPGLWRRGLNELLVRRPHPARILRLPVGQLEGLSGKDRRQRAAALAVRENVSVQLAAAFVVFEAGLVMSAVALIVLMTPDWAGVDWELFGTQFFAGTLSRPVYAVCWSLMAAVVLALHPLYVGAGFAVYLGRRTDLEGWDLEIAFRRLARRIEALGRRAAAVLLLAALAGGIAFPAPAAAQAGDPRPSDGAASDEPQATPGAWAGDPARDPRRVIAEVLARSEFQTEETVARWRLREDLLRDSSPRRQQAPVLAFAAGLIATLAEPLLWIGAAVALIFLGRAAWQRFAEEPVPRPQGPAPPERLMGLDLRRESLPADVPAAAAEAWRAGRAVAALSLLYRGALARLAEEGVELRESFTEDDCLRSAATELPPPRLDFFADLTRVWRRVAYAHEVPESSRAEQLWSSWADHFGGLS